MAKELLLFSITKDESKWKILKRWFYPSASGLIVSGMLCILKRELHREVRQKKAHTESEVKWRYRRQLEWWMPQTGEYQGIWGSHWKLKDARNRFFLESCRGSMACQDFDYRILVTRAVKELISVLLSHQVCSYLFQSSQEIKTDVNIKN